jgi:integrase
VVADFPVRGLIMSCIQIVQNRNGERRYRVRVRVKGMYVSRTIRNKREAERWARKMEDRAELGTMSAVTQSTRRTVGEMISRYCSEILPHKARNTQLVQYGQLMFWRESIGKLTLSEATTPRLSKAKETLAPRGNSTVNAYLAVLQHCFSVAMREWQWIESNPVVNVWKLPQPQSRVRMLSPAERARLLFYAKLASCPYLTTIIVVTLSTGPRKSEVRNMRFTDYDHLTGKVILDSTKNGERRTVRLFGLARVLMSELYEARQTGQLYFFPSVKNPRKPVDFRYSWEIALEKAAIPDFCFHDLRHSAASYLAGQGATLADIKEILGHKSIQTTQKYTHLTDTHTAGLVQKMNLSIF